MPDDDLESQLSEFRRRYRERDSSEDVPSEESPAEPPPESPDDPSESPADEAPERGDPDEEETQEDARDDRDVSTSGDRTGGLPLWLWGVLGCSTLIVLSGFAVGFGLWGGYRLLRTRVLVSPPDGVDLAREMVRFEMPEGTRSRAAVNLIYRLAIVENRPDPPTALLAVGSFPAGWTGNPREVFVDRFDRHFERGRITFRSAAGNGREAARQLCDRSITYERREGSLDQDDSERTVVMYHTCFRRQGETLCLRCLGLGEDAEQRARTLFESLRCP